MDIEILNSDTNRSSTAFPRTRLGTRSISGIVRDGVFHLGALGSRQAHADRLVRLGEIGINGEASRIHAPVRIDINAKTPIEIAISILAEIPQAYRAQGHRLLELKRPHPNHFCSEADSSLPP